MSSDCLTLNAAKRGRHKARNPVQIDEAAELLIARHGEEAGVRAARRADALYRRHNTAEGARWLEIFRRIAMAHPSQAL